MNRLIAQLLFFTRLEQGTEPLHAEPTDLSELTEMICEEQAMIRSSQIALEQEIQPDIWADVDRGLFSRLLTNLISNAYKYGKDGGHTLVSLMKEGQDIVLKVSDDGIGMDQETLDRINSQMTERSVRGKSQGGIAIGNVHNRIKLLFGEAYGLTVFSTRGIGTDVEITLPRTTEQDRKRIEHRAEEMK